MFPGPLLVLLEVCKGSRIDGVRYDICNRKRFGFEPGTIRRVDVIRWMK